MPFPSSLAERDEKVARHARRFTHGVADGLISPADGAGSISRPR
jgi:hypothetical protein